jgi:tetratricopeptide (TPR) repeat protein
MVTSSTTQIDAPRAAEIGSLLFEAHQIIEGLNKSRYDEADWMLHQAFLLAPLNHPIEVISFKLRAKIARLEGNYALACKHLTDAAEIAVELLGHEHADMLRLLERFALVIKGEVSPKLSASDFGPAVELFYDGQIKIAEKLGLRAVVALLKGDCAFVLERWQQACEQYDEARLYLESDQTNSNWPRLSERISIAGYERTCELETEAGT